MQNTLRKIKKKFNPWSSKFSISDNWEPSNKGGTDKIADWSCPTSTQLKNPSTANLVIFRNSANKTATIRSKENSATYAMKKPFSALKMAGLAGAFGHGRSKDEDKIRLLSVMPYDQCGEGDLSGHSTSEDGGSSTCSTTAHSAVEKSSLSFADSAATLPPALDDVSMHPNCSKAQNFGFEERPHRRNQRIAANGETTNRFDANPVGLSIIPGEISVTKTRKFSHSGPKEWIFTLCDMDKEGRITKSDIESLVRSIREVLVNTDILGMQPISGNTGKTTKISALKMTLSVVSHDGVEPDIDDSSTKAQCDGWCPRGRPVLSKHKAACNERCSMKVRNCENVDEIYEEMPLIGHCSHRRHMHRPTENHTDQWDDDRQSPEEDILPKRHCIFRDYVNLSEVENCCISSLGRVGHFDFDVPSSSRGRSIHPHNKQHGPTVHGLPRKCLHVRHCERHCICPVFSNANNLCAFNGQFFRGEFSTKCCRLAESKNPKIDVKHARETTERKILRKREKIRAFYRQTSADSAWRTRNQEMDLKINPKSHENRFPDLQLHGSTFGQNSSHQKHQNYALKAELIRNWILTDFSRQKSHDSAQMVCRINSDRCDWQTAKPKNVNYHEHHHYHHF